VAGSWSSRFRQCSLPLPCVVSEAYPGGLLKESKPATPIDSVCRNGVPSGSSLLGNCAVPKRGWRKCGVVGPEKVVGACLVGTCTQVGRQSIAVDEVCARPRSHA